MVGADLLNRSIEEKFQLLYWRERNVEVDFVIKMGKKLLAIEIKSGAAKDHRRGLNTFLNRFPQSKLLSIGGSEFLSIENFLLTPIADFFNPS
jgi:predicted AAA+ superfamily ATPase